MRLSRWGRSPYETTDDIEREAAALSAFVTVQAERTDAEVVVLHSKVPAGADLLLRAPSLKLLVTTTSVSFLTRSKASSTPPSVASTSAMVSK